MVLPQPGDAFDDGNYQLLQKLGEGGHAIVFKATERGTAQREVAVKILKPAADGYDAQTMLRFDREVRALAKLRDPHSLTLFRDGTTKSGLRFLVFEYVPGRDLAELLEERGRLDATEATHILRQLLHALHEAHELGLLHRDIKPENIRVFEYLGDPLRVKLLDFGIARRAVPDDAGVTKTGELVGTPRYMSPEQLTDRELAPSSDLYSVGMVTFEMLEGTDALQGRRLGDQIDRLRADHSFSVDDSGSAISAIVTRLCAREPRDRFQSAQDVLSALDNLESPPAPVPAPAPAAPRRVPSTVAAPPASSDTSLRLPMAGGFALLVCIAGVLAVVALGESDPPPAAPPAQSRAFGALLKSNTSTAAPTPVPDDAPDAIAEPDAAPPQDGCGRPPPFIGAGRLKDGDGLYAPNWTVFVPKDYDPEVRYPVVMIFHQDFHTGLKLIKQTGFDELADRKGFVILAPDGESIAWRHEGSVESVPSGLRITASQLCVDPQRVFAVGHGLGGNAVNFLSCAPWLAGIATNSFRLAKPGFLCDPADPIPLFYTSPMNSRRFSVDGGLGCGGSRDKLSLDAAEELWRSRNRCGDQRSEYQRVGDDVCYTWDCEKEFVSCHLVGGHSWPGSGVPEIDFLGCDHQLMTFPATEKIWEFFVTLDSNRDASPSTW